MNVYVAEFLGTAILILLGCGVNANVSLTRTKGHAAGWLTICTGWGLAVYVAVLCVEKISGAHINPAVTLGVAAAGKFNWGLLPGYVLAQMGGAMAGAAMVYLVYKSHFDATWDADAKLGTFATGPAIRSWPLNLLCEGAGTFVLVYAVLLMADPTFNMISASGETEREIPVGLGSIGALRVGLVVFCIGVCLGGPTGYAINPARDLGPRLAHALLPIRNKRDSDWSYAAIPVLGPLCGGLLAAGLYLLQ